MQTSKTIKKIKEIKKETWIGDVSEDFDLIKGKYLFENNKRIVGNESENYERLSLTLKGVLKRPKEDNEGLQPKDFETYQIVNNNELIFKLIDLNNISTSRIGLSPYIGIVSPAYIILKPKKQILPKYAEYFYYILWVFEIFNMLGDEGVRSNLNSQDLLNLYVPVPDTEEQIKIVDFLDSKCQKIDDTIEKINKQIEVLKKYKQSLITEVVTKGLDKNVEMKDSEAGWIGKIPKKWEIDKFKHHLIRSEIKNPGDAEILSLYRDYGVIPKDSRDDNYNVTSLDTSNYRFVEKGDFVVNKMKGWQGSVAVSEYEGVVSPAYFVYKFSDEKFNKKYFHYLLRSTYKEEFRRLSGGIREGQWDLPAEALENVLIIIPNKIEQEQITNFLDEKCKKIDNILDKKVKQIDVLERYKKSLIYEYVTGKKRV